MTTPSDYAGWLRKKIAEINPAAGPLEDGTELMARGVLDSLQFVELLTAIHKELGITVDFGRLDDFDAVSHVGGLAAHLAETAASGA